MISVIIPSYNRARTIERSIRSVLNQTYTDIECIIVDDCSTDNTREVIESIDDSRVRYACLEKNQGACAARNRGIEMARGEYIAFQDSDDAWTEDKLEIQLKKMIEVNADVCFCRKQIFSETGEFLKFTAQDLQEGFIPYHVLYSSSHVSTQTILAKRKVVEECLFDPKVKKAQDYEWTLRAAEHHTFFFVAQPLVKQYFQADSLTIKGKNHVVEIEMGEYFCEKYKDKIKSDPAFYAALLNRQAYYKSISHQNASKEYKQAYTLTHNKKLFIKYIFSRLGLLEIYYRNFSFTRQKINKKLKRLP